MTADGRLGKRFHATVQNGHTKNDCRRIVDELRYAVLVERVRFVRRRLRRTRAVEYVVGDYLDRARS